MEDDWLEPEEGAPELEIIPENEDILANIKPLGEDKIDTIRRINDAKKKTIKIAGLVKNTDDGSIWDEDEPYEVKIPESSIHEFKNQEVCICECHNRKKRDCMECYDHPKHLSDKRAMSIKEPPDEYDEAKILELIEQDKAKKQKPTWWQRITSENDEK